MMGVSGPESLEQLARSRGVSDRRVLAAVRAVPRESFVPPQRRGAAYIDEPTPISHGQVTSQPTLCAQMVEGLGLDGTERVLEIGTGFGFQTALLAELAGEVVSIDVWPEMVDQAGRNLAAHGAHNTRLITGDGSGGVPDLAPFDGIILSAAYPRVPEPIRAQLRTGGRCVQPIGPGGYEEVTVFERRRGGLHKLAVITEARFVRLRGEHAYPGDST